jgi:serine/threonine-protein kinase HipA
VGEGQRLAETGEPGITELARRLAVTTLVGNADMHLKNWSVLPPNRRTPVPSRRTTW